MARDIIRNAEVQATSEADAPHAEAVQQFLHAAADDPRFVARYAELLKEGSEKLIREMLIGN